jgi:hypothetical protein
MITIGVQDVTTLWEQLVTVIFPNECILLEVEPRKNIWWRVPWENIGQSGSKALIIARLSWQYVWELLSFVTLRSLNNRTKNKGFKFNNLTKFKTWNEFLNFYWISKFEWTFRTDKILILQTLLYSEKQKYFKTELSKFSSKSQRFEIIGSKVCIEKELFFNLKKS